MQKSIQNDKPIQTQRIKPKPKPTIIFKNCSYVCVHITVHNWQHNTEQLWQSFLLFSRQSSLLRCWLSSEWSEITNHFTNASCIPWEYTTAQGSWASCTTSASAMPYADNMPAYLATSNHWILQHISIYIRLATNWQFWSTNSPSVQ